MTIRLYNRDPYKRECEATIERIEENRATLSQTCFFPSSGGQAGDSGFIKGVRVRETNLVNTQITEINGEKIPSGGEIVHLLEGKHNLQVGEKVSIKIDWVKRLRTMKLHAASHIMEHFLIQTFGQLQRLGSQVDERKDRSDYGTEGILESSRLQQVEEQCNQFISQGHAIETKPSEKNPEIREWTCEKIKMFCGGTHVKNTSEIGKIKLKRKNKGRGIERVETYLVEE